MLEAAGLWRDRSGALELLSPTEGADGPAAAPGAANYCVVATAPASGVSVYSSAAVQRRLDRQCLLIHPARSITSDHVLDTLQRLTDLKGAPAYIRSDNGSEFIAHIIQEWCHTADVQTLYIEPGSPWQNPFIESFYSRFRDECLNQEIFFSIAETRVVVEDYRRLYNGERPHSSLGYKTPDEFAQNLTVQTADTQQTSHPK